MKLKNTTAILFFLICAVIGVYSCLYLWKIDLSGITDSKDSVESQLKDIRGFRTPVCVFLAVFGFVSAVFWSMCIQDKIEPTNLKVSILSIILLGLNYILGISICLGIIWLIVNVGEVFILAAAAWMIASVVFGTDDFDDYKSVFGIGHSISDWLVKLRKVEYNLLIFKHALNLYLKTAKY